MLKNIAKLISLAGFLVLLHFVAPGYQVRNADLGASAAKEPRQTAVVSEEPLELEAKAACVFDLRKNKFIFELNSETRLPLASLTKLMTAVVAEENLPESTLVEITPEAIAQEGDSGLAAGEFWKLEDILKAMLVASSNDAAFAVASSLRNGLEINDTAFVKLMNQKAEILGLKQANFYNATGLDLSEEAAGAYGSCSDITKLMVYVLENHPQLLEATAGESLVVGDREFENTNILLPKLPVFLGGKTGFSDLAGGNLIVVVDRGLVNPMILTVLGSSFDGRFTDVEKLYNGFVK